MVQVVLDYAIDAQILNRSVVDVAVLSKSI